MGRQCLFCPNAATTKEHLWADWILKAIAPRTKPIQMQLGKSAPVEFWGDVRVKCVCRFCNNGWMSALEATAKPLVGAMLHDLSITLTAEDQKVVALWAAKTAMVLEGTIRDQAHRLYTEGECAELRLHSTIPDRSLLWLGRIAESGLFASGTHVWLQDNFAKACDGQVSTFSVGYLALQVLTIHIRPEDHEKAIQTRCYDGPWDDSLLGIYPANQAVTWPPRLTFTTRGGHPLFSTLRDRWKVGKRRT